MWKGRQMYWYTCSNHGASPEIVLRSLHRQRSVECALSHLCLTRSFMGASGFDSSILIIKENWPDAWYNFQEEEEDRFINGHQVLLTNSDNCSVPKTGTPAGPSYEYSYSWEKITWSTQNFLLLEQSEGFLIFERRCSIFCVKVVNCWLFISHSDPSGQNMFLPFFPASHVLRLNPNPNTASINLYHTISFPSGLVTKIFVFNLKHLFHVFIDQPCSSPCNAGSLQSLPLLLSFSICCASRCRSETVISFINAYIAESHSFILGCKVCGIKGSKLRVGFLDIVISMKTWI